MKKKVILLLVFVFLAVTLIPVLAFANAAAPKPVAAQASKTVAASQIKTAETESCIVTFDSQGGSSVAPQTVHTGAAAVAPTVPTLLGYTFGGWYREKGCTTAWNFSTDTVSVSLTLYAKWNYGEPAPAYKASVSAASVYSGSAVTFTLTTPKTVTSLKLYLDSKYNMNAACVKTSGDSKLWTAKLSLNGIGNRKVQFKAYTASSLQKTFPSPAFSITVKHAVPVTKPAIVLDYDRAVLLGVPPVYSGQKQTSQGFYFGTSADKLTKKISSNKIVRGKSNKMVTGLKAQTTYYYAAYTATSAGVLKGAVQSFTTPAKKTWSASDAVFSKIDDRYVYLFGCTGKFYTMKNPPFGYVTKSEADQQITKISVPVWKLKSGKKTSATWTLYTNYKLANNVRAIFKEIYALDIKFPIEALKGYSYRHISGPGLGSNNPIMSHHSFGGAIDINKPHNLYYLNRDKRDKKSPYYIPKSVINIFAKYGWAWGGNFKEGFDTMHMQYLGLDLTGK